MSDPQRSVSDSPHSPRGRRQRPEYRSQFDIAIVCALPLEYDAVTLLVDEFWDETGDSYGRAVGDSNSYTTGRIGTHNVVVALLPGMGKVNAAVAVGGLRSSYTDIKLVLLVGICGGVPRAGNNDEILLGDVIISETVVQYDYGRRYPDSFATRTATGEGFSRPNTDIRGLIAFLRSEAGSGHLQQRTSYFLQMLQQRASQRRRSNYNYPGTASDKLFAPEHRHRHHGPCSCICSQWKALSDPVCQEALSIPCSQTGCEDANLVPRKRLEMRHELEKQKERIDIQEPLIFVGRIASGDTVMKSGKDRDRIAKEQNVIAFEMEGAGFWEELPCLVVKGVCDYADSHKDKSWQTFAAATAAATMKALIEKYIRTDRKLTPSTLASSGFASAQSWDTTSPKLANSSTVSQNEPYTNVTSKEWNAKLSEMIKATPNTPSWLSHTAPYERFVSEVENIIWYQTIDPEVGAGIDLEHECEGITISLLGDLERWEVKRRVEQIAQAKKLDSTLQRPNEPILRKRKRKSKRQHLIPTSEAGLGTSFLGPPIVPGGEQQGEVSGETPSVSRIKRVYLFYTPSEKSEDDEPFAMSPLQSFLWSLVSQALLWKTSSMGLFLDWYGVVDPQTSRLCKIPEVSELKAFLWNLIKIQGSPVVITVCRADVLLHDIGREPIEFLANLCNTTVILGVQVSLILSTFDQTSSLPGVKSSQVLNRYTERDECLGNFQFEGQFLRRDEIQGRTHGYGLIRHSSHGKTSHLGYCGLKEKLGAGSPSSLKLLRPDFQSRGNQIVAEFRCRKLATGSTAHATEASRDLMSIS
ncbi:nucleoside phosphorylase domain-containing protein [Bipolaris maydis]|nr:nucleoside phosphorylase domain-containing protein [Bipolaris maydis]KAJ6278068.1 nucleoside phosphorylase domain-containing protein [Bipolaris maydis]